MRRRTALVFAALLAAGTATGVAATGEVTRVSVSDIGAEANAAAEGAAVSADGRFVAFVSTAELTSAETGGKKQLYVRDRQTGRTILASASATGAADDGNVNPGDQFNPGFDVTGDGRYAVFASTATNLGGGDANANADVFRKDLRTGAVTLVSVNAAGQQADAGVLGDPSISADGTRVAFTTGTATNLVPGDSGTRSDVVLRDIAAGTTELVSRNSQGQQSNGTSERPSISADGRVVAFEAVLDTTNLFPGDANNANDIIVRDLAAGTAVPADVATDGTVKGANIPDISGDGRYVVFQTGESLDPANDPNGLDVYRRDLRSGVTTLVSARTGADGRGNGGSRVATISADGTRVAFESDATDLTATDTNANTDVYVRDIPARTTVRASARADGGQADNASSLGIVAPGGGPVAFVYDDAVGKPLVTGDANALPDVFLKELAPSDTTGPAITVTGPSAPVAGDSAVLTGTVTDPSGVGALSLDGTAVPVAADGTFRATVRLGAPGTTTTATFTARDGAGAASTAAQRIARAPAAVTAAPRATALRVTRRGTRVTLRFRLTAAATVTVRVLRAGRPAGPRVTRRMAAGTRTLTVRLPRVRPGAHRVVVTVRAGGRTTTAAARFTVRR
ncbi:MAG: PD40 domain-containing protein [Thermoleophilia bacterium]|nr:PD40 domain-containing protein [Thermoleophilia bacterium]